MQINQEIIYFHVDPDAGTAGPMHLWNFSGCTIVDCVPTMLNSLVMFQISNPLFFKCQYIFCLLSMNKDTYLASDECNHQHVDGQQ